MEKNAIKPFAPYNFSRCFNAQCPKADQCLHHLAATKETKDDYSVLIINPLRIPEDLSLCPAFQSNEKVKVAWGLKHLFDNIVYKKVDTIRDRLICHFGKTKYYRIYRNEIGLLPIDQDFIRRVFKEKGVEKEPIYDEYTEEYLW